MNIFFTLKFEGRAYSIQVSETPVTIGRSKACTYTINDSKLSSRHCLLYIKNNILYVEDLESKNGVNLNGINIFKQRVYLNDIILIGECEISIDRLKLSQDTLEVLGPDSAVAREVTLELATPIELETPKPIKRKKQAFTQQNKKLYKGLKSIEDDEDKKPAKKKNKLLFYMIGVLFIIVGLIASELFS